VTTPREPYNPAAVFVFSVQVCAECGEQVHHDADGNWDACGRCDCLESTEVRFRVGRAQLLKQAKPELASIEGTVYFGCWRESGHYYWLRGMQKARGYGVAAYAELTPWGHSVDGGLFGRGVQPGQGVASIFHKDGWTALAFEDRSVDSRPGSWSVFCIPEVLMFDEALRIARLAFPQVFERFTFEVRERTP
jgi:hypothetical protein